jgi:TM2 domain-containing membrane protein YozV
MNHWINYPDMSFEEMQMINEGTKNFTETQMQKFDMYYRNNRKNPQEILIFTLLGFFGIAGINKFILGKTGLGILYFLTGGLCLIGVIIDLINYKEHTWDFNREKAYQALQLAQL